MEKDQTNQPQTTPKSTKNKKKELHMKKLQSINFPIEDCKTYVLGISGGDCAGKRQLIQYLFQKNRNDEWTLPQNKQPVTIVNQEYFKCGQNEGEYFSAKGTNWDLFYKEVLNLMIGNDVKVKFQRNGEQNVIHLKPAKLIVLQGSHIFMEDTHKLSSLINLRVFIDSDADIQLSRRVYKDTQENGMELNKSIANYLEYIKPSYELQIKPTKRESDIIIPHFGGGFNDHRKANKLDYSSNVKNAGTLIAVQLKEEMKKYQQSVVEEEQ